MHKMYNLPPLLTNNRMKLIKMLQISPSRLDDGWILLLNRPQNGLPTIESKQSKQTMTGKSQETNSHLLWAIVCVTFIIILLKCTWFSLPNRIASNRIETMAIVRQLFVMPMDFQPFGRIVRLTWWLTAAAALVTNLAAAVQFDAEWLTLILEFVNQTMNDAFC